MDYRSSEIAKDSGKFEARGSLKSPDDLEYRQVLVGIEAMSEC